VATGDSPRRINGIVHRKRPISADMALRLARCFGTTERYWLNLHGRRDVEVERDRLTPTLNALCQGIVRGKL
jgi:addiction module HigA family antidote